MDVLTKSQRSYCMSQIRAKDTKPEIYLRKLLWKHGLRYRIHYNLTGKPDIVFVGVKIVVFVDGCFWHGCPRHCNQSKTNTEFWDRKIQGNIKRDKKVNAILKSQGWKILRFWEHDIDNSIKNVVKKITTEVYKRKSLQRGF